MKIFMILMSQLVSKPLCRFIGEKIFANQGIYIIETLSLHMK